MIFPQHSGHDSWKVWSEYKLKIEEYLAEINNDTNLRKARETAAEIVYNEHYRAYPCWPARGTSQQSTVRINASGGYSRVNEEIFWSVKGDITVKVSGYLCV